MYQIDSKIFISISSVLPFQFSSFFFSSIISEFGSHTSFLINRSAFIYAVCIPVWVNIQTLNLVRDCTLGGPTWGKRKLKPHGGCRNLYVLMYVSSKVYVHIMPLDDLILGLPLIVQLKFNFSLFCVQVLTLDRDFWFLFLILLVILIDSPIPISL